MVARQSVSLSVTYVFIMYLCDPNETEKSGRVCSISENVAVYLNAQQCQNVEQNGEG